VIAQQVQKLVSNKSTAQTMEERQRVHFPQISEHEHWLNNDWNENVRSATHFADSPQQNFRGGEARERERDKCLI
jgi:hypothetical protein